MKQYNIKYDQTIIIVLTIIFVPLTVVPAFIWMAYNLNHLPEWALYAIITALLGVAILLLKYVIKRISPTGILTLNEDGFEVKFPQRTLFTPRTFEIKTTDIINFFTDGNQAGYYMNFSTRVRPATFNISSAGKEEEANFLELMEAVAEMIEKRNEAVGNTAAGGIGKVSGVESGAVAPTPITTISIYQRTWVKVIVVVAGILFAGMALVSVFAPLAEHPSLLKLAVVLLIGLPIVYKVYQANKKKK